MRGHGAYSTNYWQAPMTLVHEPVWYCPLPTNLPVPSPLPLQPTSLHLFWPVISSTLCTCQQPFPCICSLTHPTLISALATQLSCPWAVLAVSGLNDQQCIPSPATGLGCQDSQAWVVGCWWEWLWYVGVIVSRLDWHSYYWHLEHPLQGPHVLTSNQKAKFWPYLGGETWKCQLHAVSGPWAVRDPTTHNGSSLDRWSSVSPWLWDAVIRWV